jgi:hypothetical protein
VSWYSCPYCGEEVDTEPDRGGGEELQYVEDCPVCCHPNVIVAAYDPESDDFIITATRES